MINLGFPIAKRTLSSIRTASLLLQPYRVLQRYENIGRIFNLLFVLCIRLITESTDLESKVL